jgi:hypothetical protein
MHGLKNIVRCGTAGNSPNNNTNGNREGSGTAGNSPNNNTNGNREGIENAKINKK